MQIQLRQALGRFRSWFFPVHKNELKLFLPLLAIFCCICFNYNLLRAAKDSLVLTAPSAGAEVIPFIKVWVVLPMALLMTVLFTRLSNKYTTEKIFYLLISFFLGFFILFAFVLFPLKDVLHPHQFADRLEQLLPLGFKGFIALIRNWTYTAFYVMAEFWGTTIMTVLFWGFANEILNVETAKRFYVLILFGGNISAICAGLVGTFVSKHASQWALSTHIDDPWRYSLLMLSTLVVVGGILIIILFRWLHVKILKNSNYNSYFSYTSKQNSMKMGLRKNFSYLINSKYLLCIATIVLTYNICINLTEVTWKNQLLQLYSRPNELNAYMNQVTMWVGITATTIAIISTFTIARYSWTFNAMIPPILLLISGLNFFLFLIFKDSRAGIYVAQLLGNSSTAIAILLGSIQQCISRGSKYTIFDATKELSFIPLDKESKLKGKAAIDGVTSRLGKSGSALIYQLLLVIFGTIQNTTPYIGIALFFIVIAWITAVYILGNQFALTDSKTLKPNSENQKEPVS